jgi:glutathione-regulated potassium-efflux system ancillary protein KefC
MLLTPVCVKIHEYWEAKRENNNDRAADSIIDDSAPVIIAGFGRVGQIVGRLLFANGIKATVLDYEPEQIELLRRFGFQVYYGDATRIDLLTAAGAAHAKILVAAIDDVESNLHLVDVVRQNFPNLKIISRARNVSHLFELMDRGVTDYERETFDSSLRLGRRVLESLGVHPSQAHSATQFFRSFDLNLMNELHAERGDEKSRISKAKQAREDIIRLFSEEEARIKNPNNAWGD